MTVDMGPPELNGPKVPSTLPTNADGVVLKEPIQVRLAALCAHGAIVYLEDRRNEQQGQHHAIGATV